MNEIIDYLIRWVSELPKSREWHIHYTGNEIIDISISDYKFKNDIEVYISEIHLNSLLQRVKNLTEGI